MNNGEALLEYPDGRSVAKPLGETCAAADALKEFLNEFRVDGDGSELCGLFGYTAFDAVRYFENIPVREFHHRDSDAPDICYILYKFLLVFDHFKNELSIVELCADGERDHIREGRDAIEGPQFRFVQFPHGRRAPFEPHRRDLPGDGSPRRAPLPARRRVSRSC